MRCEPEDWSSQSMERVHAESCVPAYLVGVSGRRYLHLSTIPALPMHGNPGESVNKFVPNGGGGRRHSYPSAHMVDRASPNLHKG